MRAQIKVTYRGIQETTKGKKVKVGFECGLNVLVDPTNILARKAGVGYIVDMDFSFKAKPEGERVYLNMFIQNIHGISKPEEDQRFEDLPDLPNLELDNTPSSGSGIGRI